MKQLIYSLLFCISFFLKVAHADVSWDFVIDNPNVLTGSKEAFSVQGSIINLATSTSALTLNEFNEECISCARVGLFIGMDSDFFHVFGIDASNIYTALSSLSLNPGERFSFTAYTVSPSEGYFPIGNYSFNSNTLFLPGYGFNRGGAVNISVVPEPETHVLLIAGLALIGFVQRRSKSYYRHGTKKPIASDSDEYLPIKQQYLTA